MSTSFSSNDRLVTVLQAPSGWSILGGNHNFFNLMLDMIHVAAYNGRMALLSVRNLKKKYGNSVAVEDISFAVGKGTCYGLLGPNGAGKTTTMEVVEDIIPATSGTILYKGKARDLHFREETGIQFQHTSLLNFLSVKETLQCYQKLFKHPEKIDTLIERCNLSPILNKRNNQLSGGQQQRLMLALALINRPALIFLDEPSTGLDPQSRRYLWDIVEDIKDDGKTIVMTTHSMEEAEFLCDTIAIVDQGSIIAEGSPAELIAKHCKTNTITLPLSVIENKLPTLAEDFSLHGNSIVIRSLNVERTLRTLMAADIDLKEMVVDSPDLEDVFLYLTGRTLRD